MHFLFNPTSVPLFSDFYYNGYVQKNKDKSFPRITSRTKKHPLKIEGEIMLKDGLQIKTSKGMCSTGHKPIKATLTISREDIERLHSLILHNPKYFLPAFWDKFIGPALGFMAKGARGKFKGKGNTLWWIKAGAGELHNLFAFLIKKTDPTSYPSYFRKLIQSIDPSEKEYLLDGKGRLDQCRYRTDRADVGKYRDRAGFRRRLARLPAEAGDA